MKDRLDSVAKGSDFAEDQQPSESRGTNDVPAVSPTVNPEEAQPINSSTQDFQDGQLEKVSTMEEQEAKVTPVESNGPPFSVFTRQQKRFIVVMASWAGFFSPVSGNIYFPALNSLSQDLNVSISLINLTLTSYMIFQGLAPAFIGDLADKAGRRPAYAVCFIIYLAANIGLALQNSYAALFVLRCLQSAGSSSTVALSSGVVSDVATASERGKYMGFVTAGALLGPSIGPVVGGVLSQYLGWRAIFWFLTILAATFTIVFLIFFPETARSVVGDGSIAPRAYSMSLLNYLQARKHRSGSSNSLAPTKSRESARPKRRLRFPNPLASVRILMDKETFLLLSYNACLFAGFYDITATIPPLYADIYGFDDLKIGLCYLSLGSGASLAALMNGQMLDRNFHRIARQLNFPVNKKRQSDLSKFPIEKARLQIAIPLCYVGCACLIIHGWIMNIEGPLAADLVVLFIGCYSLTGAFNVTSTLIIDFYPTTSATATAANNLLRCLLGAGATAVVQPMLQGMGRGWTFTFVALVLIALTPTLWVVYFKGMSWREARRLRMEKLDDEKKQRRAGRVEEGDSPKRANSSNSP
ncbi:MAG: hypothetical protein Q9160_003310 [Pyrenula sp. 1 TL-2023]